MRITENAIFGHSIVLFCCDDMHAGEIQENSLFKVVSLLAVLIPKNTLFFIRTKKDTVNWTKMIPSTWPDYLVAKLPESSPEVRQLQGKLNPKP